MREFFASIRYYGIGKIIKDYCGFPYYLPLPVSIQHGWYLFVTKHDAMKYASENWYWSKSIEQKHIKNDELAPVKQHPDSVIIP